jgi:hypothetical protein
MLVSIPMYCNNLGVAVTGNYNTKGYQTSTIYRLFIVEILSQQPQVYNNYQSTPPRLQSGHLAGSVPVHLYYLPPLSMFPPPPPSSS